MVTVASVDQGANDSYDKVGHEDDFNRRFHLKKDQLSPFLEFLEEIIIAVDISS